MKFLKYILITALTLSLATQGFTMEIVGRNYTERRDAYNKSPTNGRIPNYTENLNQLFAREPNKKPLEQKDLKGAQEEILKAVIGTALIHGKNMSFEIPAHASLTPAVRSHFQILDYAQSFSQKYTERLGRADIDTYNSTLIEHIGRSAEDADSIAAAYKAARDVVSDKALTFINSIIELDTDFRELQKLSGITKEDFNKWFSEVYKNHNEGLYTQNGGYWRDLKSKERGEPSSLSAVDPDLEKVLAESMKEFPAYISFVSTNGDPDIIFERYHVPGDGTCGFYAIGKTRKEVANAVSEYFSTNKPFHEDERLKEELRGGLFDTTTTNTSAIRLLSDEEIENLFLDRRSHQFNADLARTSIQKIRTRLHGDEYVSTSMLALCAKLFNFNLHIFVKNEKGEAEFRQSFTQSDFNQVNTNTTNTTNAIYILNNASAGLNAHYDLLVNPSEQNAANERERGKALELSNLGQNLDRSEAHLKRYLGYDPFDLLQEDGKEGGHRQALEASLHDLKLKQEHKAPAIEVLKLKEMPLELFADMPPEILKAYLDKGSMQIEYYDEIYKDASFDRNVPVQGLKRMVYFAVYSALRRHEIYPGAPELDKNSKENLLAILDDPDVQNDTISPNFLNVIVFEIGFILQEGEDVKANRSLDSINVLERTHYLHKLWLKHQKDGGIRKLYQSYIRTPQPPEDIVINRVLAETSGEEYHDYILFGNKAAALEYPILAEGLLSTPFKIYYGLPMYVSKFYKDNNFSPINFYIHDRSHKRSMRLSGTIMQKRSIIAKLKYSIEQYSDPELRIFLLNFMSFLVFWDLHEEGRVAIKGKSISDIMEQYGKEFKDRLANEDAIEALQWVVKKSHTLFTEAEVARFKQLDPRNNDAQVLLYELRFELFDIVFDKFLAGIMAAVVAEKTAHLSS